MNRKAAIQGPRTGIGIGKNPTEATLGFKSRSAVQMEFFIGTGDPYSFPAVVNLIDDQAGENPEERCERP